MIKVTDGLCSIKPESTFTIYDVEQFVHAMREKLPNIKAIELDFSALAEFDTAGFQAIYALHKSAQEQNVSMNFIDYSPVVDRIITLFGVNDWFQALVKKGDGNATH